MVAKVEDLRPAQQQLLLDNNNSTTMDTEDRAPDGAPRMKVRLVSECGADSIMC